MSKLLTFIAFLIFCFSLNSYAQEQLEEMNNIKLAGLYYTGEAFGVEHTDAYNSAMSSLVNKINAKQIERGGNQITQEMIKGKEKNIKIPSEEGVRVFVYVSKKEVQRMLDALALNVPGTPDPPATTVTNSQSTPPAVEQGAAPSESESQAGLTFNPNVIQGKRQAVVSKLLNAEVFSAVENILKQERLEDPSLVYGKASVVGNTDNCYIIIINKNMYVEAILSAKTNGVRRNIKTQQQQEKGNFPNCAAIYFR